MFQFANEASSVNDNEHTGSHSLNLRFKSTVHPRPVYTEKKKEKKKTQV